MKCLKLALAGSILFPLLSTAGSYRESIERLNVTDPELVVHVNLEDDFSLLGSVLSEVYLEYLKTAPDIPPVPISFERLFERLGLANLASMTITSERLSSGFLNQSMSSFDGPPTGLFALLGTENRPFAISQSAPADADVVGEFSLNATAILEIVQNLAVDIMGPMGQGMIDAQLNQPLNESGMTLKDVINQMNTRVQVAIQAPGEIPQNQQMALAMISGKTAISFEGMGNLVEALAPMLQGVGFTSAGENILQMALPVPGMSLSMMLQAVNGKSDLLLTFSDNSAQWFLSGSGAPAGLDKLQAGIGDHPDSGLAFFYDNGALSRLQAKSMWGDMQFDEKFAPILKIVEDFMMRFTGPQLSYSFMDENHQRTMAWQPVSTKANMGAMMVVMPAAMAVGYGQAMQKAEDQGESETADPAADGTLPPQ